MSVILEEISTLLGQAGQACHDLDQFALGLSKEIAATTALDDQFPGFLVALARFRSELGLLREAHSCYYGIMETAFGPGKG